MFPYKLYDYIFEAPLAYDDESDKLIGKTDSETKTKWGKLPPTNLTIEELTVWVNERDRDGTLKGEIVGRGATRQAEFNDGKTVFKWNYSHAIGNQTKVEAQTYTKYGKEFSDILPKMYRHGENWIVQEKAEPFTSEKFKQVAHLERIMRPTANAGIVLRAYFELMSGVIEVVPFDMLKEYRKKSFDTFVSMMEDKGFYDIGYTTIYHVLTNNDNVFRIVEFCAKTNVALEDMRPANLGFIGDRLVVIDSGFKFGVNK